MILVALLWASPILLLIGTALRSGADFLAHGPLSWPRSLTWANFRDAWSTGDFGTAFTNSALLTLVKVPLGVVLSSLLAYALAKLRLPFRRGIMFLVLLGLTMPIFIAVVPLFTMLRSVHLTDNLWGLLAPYLAFGLPFQVLILESFFRKVPEDLLNAARIDGAGSLRIFLRIVLPMSLPALVTVAILDVAATWNELLMALVLLSSPEHRTVPLGLLNFQGQFSSNLTGLSAGVLITIAPILLIYACLQRWIVGGLTAGAIKE